MACGACKKSSKKKTDKSETKTLGIPRKVGIFILALGVAIIATPFLFITLIYALYQGWAGDGFNISALVDKLKKKSPEVEVVEDINPDDYELVGVEKIA